MKKKTVISIIVVIILIPIIYFTFYETIDRFNPWIEEEYVYVEVKEEPTDDDGRFKYREEGITEKGETKRVIFTTSTRLKEGTFLKVLAKGAHTVEYIYITEEEMP